jgi:hypothetical protein
MLASYSACGNATPTCILPAMRLILQGLPSTLRGETNKYLAPEAAVSLLKLEEDIGPLEYREFWRGADGSLLARRTRKTSQIPGYSAHNYGLAFDLNLEKVLDEKKISYEDLLYVLAKRGWYCIRRDGLNVKPEGEHFNYLGEKKIAEQYLARTTQDPVTWDRAAEEKIYELYGKDFLYDASELQTKLKKLRMYTGIISGKIDQLTRESIKAFQRAWDLVEDGLTGFTFQRVLAFVSAEIDFLPDGVPPQEDEFHRITGVLDQS